MANRASVPAKEVVGTKAALDQFTRHIMQVPHSAIKSKLEAEKKVKPSYSRASAASSNEAS